MQSNKTVVLFLIKFFGAYTILFLSYSFYLDQTQNTNGDLSCAPITKSVAKQTQYVLTAIGYQSNIEQDAKEISVKLFLNDKFVARIVEGCNSISIIILFASFIIAFSKGFKRTSLFIVFGSLIIYYSNIFRIAIISIALYKYPTYKFLLHDILFPVMIYGITFLLWFVWVRNFQNTKSE